MIDLKQKELWEWQKKNFGKDKTTILQCTMGMAEEVGEITHHVLKGYQGIRGGTEGINKAEVADGVADTVIYGLQVLSCLGIDAEEEISAVISKILQRNWKEDPSGATIAKPIQLSS